jgi:hypothetical protein
MTKELSLRGARQRDEATPMTTVSPHAHPEIASSAFGLLAMTKGKMSLRVERSEAKRAALRAQRSNLPR